MENKILDMKYVIENGTDYDYFESEMFTDKLLDPVSGEGCVDRGDVPFLSIK